MSKSSGLCHDSAQWVQAHCHKLEELPSPDHQWTSSETDFEHGLIRKMRVEGVIHKVGRVRKKTLFQTTEAGYGAVVKALEERERKDGLLPCGHSAFVNTGESIECKRCEGSFSRSEVKA